MSKREPYEFGNAPKSSPVVWKSLDAVEAPEVQKARATQEFPDRIDVPAESLLGRRTFLTLASATAAAVGLDGCIRRPVENIVPYARAPENVIPGIALHYATVIRDRTDALGLLVTTHEGRPTKIEGNPDHPTSAGAASLQAQASLLDLYDPDRSMSPIQRSGEGGATAREFRELDAALHAKLGELERTGGRGLRVLAAPNGSPSFARLRGALTTRFPQAQLHTWTSTSEANALAGARMAFDVPMRTIPMLEAASIVLSLDCDFLQTEAGSVRAAGGYSIGRRRGLAGATGTMSRLYAVESTFSTTGANADHRLRLASRDVEKYVRALAAELANTHRLALGGIAGALGADANGIPAKWIAEVAKDLVAAGRSALVLVGSRQPPIVHALAHAINGALGAGGTTVRWVPTTEGLGGFAAAQNAADLAEAQGTTTDISALAHDIAAGTVDTLVILGGNPAYDAPADLHFGAALARVPTTIHLASRVDETSSKCTWHVPIAHELETWGDQRSHDGTVAIQQPMIAPLRGGRSEIELLAQLAGERNWRGHEVVRTTLRQLTGGTSDFETKWRASLRSGVVTSVTPDVAAPSYAPNNESIAAALRTTPASAARPLGNDNLEIVFAACNKMLDGRHANNAWLCEMPDPITRITWDNAALVSPRTAQALGITRTSKIRITRGDASVEMAAWIVPGHADNSLTLPLGWGRTMAGRHGNGHGFDVHPLRTSDAVHFADGARVQVVGDYQIVQTQDHWDMEGRPIAVDATLAEYLREPTFASYRSVEPETPPLWQQVNYDGYKWGMSIDLTACTGCNACVIACQAENNIPIVGKDQVRRGREMHWIRIDRYFLNAPTNEERAHDIETPVDIHDPVVAFQPVACQQCEDAPCENVCPVNATTHSPEGLNDMVYNRCIGTRYCANNCPYKVRRFNYLAFQAPFDNVVEEKRMQFNPNVTVRMRGVMEKCTYCVQRIQQAKIETRNAGRKIRTRASAEGRGGGDITPACAQTCPADAIVFGDLNDPDSGVAKLRATDRRYGLLAELGTQPRTSYLAKIRNPNPEMLA